MTFFSEFHPNQTNFHDHFMNHGVVRVLRNETIDADTYFRNLASESGIPLIYEEDPITGIINFDKWTEIKFESEKAFDSYKSSNKYQPLHTDYGYFSFEIYAAFFYCVEQAQFGGATTFIDVETIVSILKSANTKLFNAVQTNIIQFGRKGNPIAQNKDLILQKDHLGWKINWNYYRALGDTENATLIQDFKDFLDTYIEKSGELLEL